MIANFESRYLQKLDDRIREDIEALRKSFGAHIIRTDAAATGMNLVQVLGKIAGLETALKHMQEVHAEMTGRGSVKAKQKEDA